jgi:hypothetical protein
VSADARMPLYLTTISRTACLKITLPLHLQATQPYRALVPHLQAPDIRRHSRNDGLDGTRETLDGLLYQSGGRLIAPRWLTAALRRLVEILSFFSFHLFMFRSTYLFNLDQTAGYKNKDFFHSYHILHSQMAAHGPQTTRNVSWRCIPRWNSFSSPRSCQVPSFVSCGTPLELGVDACRSSIFLRLNLSHVW